MKTILSLIAATIFSMSTFASNTADHGDKYCARMKDGVKVIMYDGKQLMAEVALTDGSRLKTDGTVIKKDGTTWNLKEDDCLSKDGVVYDKDKKDMKK
jgi:hypothetical protein